VVDCGIMNEVFGLKTQASHVLASRIASSSWHVERSFFSGSQAGKLVEEMRLIVRELLVALHHKISVQHVADNGTDVVLKQTAPSVHLDL
jgi:hypothetical protein